MNNLKIIPTFKTYGCRRIAAMQKNEKLRGRFALGRGVTSMDLNVLSVNHGQHPSGDRHEKVEMQYFRISQGVGLGSVSPRVKAEALGNFEFPKGEKKRHNG